MKNNDIKKAYEYTIKENEYKKNLTNNIKPKKVTIEDVATIINKKTKIPVYEILKDNKFDIELCKKKIQVYYDKKLIDYLKK